MSTNFSFRGEKVTTVTGDDYAPPGVVGTNSGPRHGVSPGDRLPEPGPMGEMGAFDPVIYPELSQLRESIAVPAGEN